jgi:hypothetical protein
MKKDALREKIVSARQRLLTAESELERALSAIAGAPREDKSIIGGALNSALAVVKAARLDVSALEQVVAEED